MLEAKHLLEACRRIERHLKAIEKEYKKKNIIHRLKEDQGYNFYRGKLFAYQFILKESYGCTKGQ